MSYLLDTNVLSELRRTARADANVLAWVRSVPTSSLYVSVISILEIEKGVRQAERSDPSKGLVLRRWLDTGVLTAFAGRVLDVDVPVARCCAGLHVPNRKSEGDALIAATAIVHGLAVVTRNVRDFEGCGVPLIDPWIAA
ncbi:type II toxin-antitoxin system VapC family toxin [Xanthobacter autotrophicus]|uniref:Ribonuclease VapC n=1 Tax=Xanthobacter dioxanivorans TaxID=2528964 RepID=A0A974PUR0_9HYPH|nr:MULTISPECIES: type II toxin-antitoxin system VapC family toxin [Xanthobacter]QRG10142.1 type II toxin-antitoxin system VapC family toxin [Xanthobacter dioxanivorans]UDQ88616.1 type II toxin-antitoxin system VapC family toxin [Xanthobacter autotrophicus]